MEPFWLQGPFNAYGYLTLHACLQPQLAHKSPKLSAENQFGLHTLDGNDRPKTLNLMPNSLTVQIQAFETYKESQRCMKFTKMLKITV